MKDENSKKIVIAGLDNSGKTSIVLNLTGKVNLMNFISLSPTVGADIVNHSVNRSNISIWDLGGQDRFRKSYLNDFMSFFRGVRKLIYVIDVQDRERYDLALEYLNAICNNIKKNNLNLDINVFLHKMDPNIEEIIQDFSKEEIESLANKVSNILPENLFSEIYKTSIYTVFEKKLFL